MLRILSIIFKARMILALWTVAIIFLSAAALDLADRERRGDLASNLGIGLLLLGAAAWFTRRAVGNDSQRQVDALIRARRAKMEAEGAGGARTCRACGAVNEGDADFCKGCGARLG